MICMTEIGMDKLVCIHKLILVRRAGAAFK
jgi:hypothetical protein